MTWRQTGESMSGVSVSTDPARTVSGTECVAVSRGAISAVIGDSARGVTRVAAIDTAGPDALTFCQIDGDGGIRRVNASHAGIVICTPAVAHLAHTTATLLVAAVPRLAFARVVSACFAPPSPHGHHATAVIDDTARVAASAFVGPHVVIGADCVVGEHCVLHPGVVLYAGTRLGARVTVHAGTVIGADGFGYHRNEDGALEKLPHLGGVEIDDDVEIGANSCIDRGTLGDTRILPRVRIDNLVHIAHNVVIESDAAIIAHAMIAGSAHIGARAWIAPAASVKDGGISIGADAVVGMGAVVLSHVASGATVVGNPARVLEKK